MDARTQRRDWLAFDRSDWIGLTVLLGLVVVLTAAVQVIGPLIGWARGDALLVPYVGPVSVPALDAVGQPYSEGHFDLRLTAPSTGQRLLDLAPGLLVLAVIATGCWLLYRLMRDIRAGEPFTARNVTRLRLIAALSALGLPIVAFARLSCTGAIQAGVDLGTLPVVTWFDIPWVAVVAGMCIALLAEAFKAGSRLREDVEGLV